MHNVQASKHGTNDQQRVGLNVSMIPVLQGREKYFKDQQQGLLLYIAMIGPHLNGPNGGEPVCCTASTHGVEYGLS